MDYATMQLGKWTMLPGNHTIEMKPCRAKPLLHSLLALKF